MRDGDRVGGAPSPSRASRRTSRQDVGRALEATRICEAAAGREVKLPRDRPMQALHLRSLDVATEAIPHLGDRLGYPRNHRRRRTRVSNVPVQMSPRRDRLLDEGVERTCRIEPDDGVGLRPVEDLRKALAGEASKTARSRRVEAGSHPAAWIHVQVVGPMKSLAEAGRPERKSREIQSLQGVVLASGGGPDVNGFRRCQQPRSPGAPWSRSSPERGGPWGCRSPHSSGDSHRSWSRPRMNVARVSYGRRSKATSP